VIGAVKSNVPVILDQRTGHSWNLYRSPMAV
jgi:hypothetical protein